MQKLIQKYETKLWEHGLITTPPLIGALDADFYWNRNDPIISQLDLLFDHLHINSVLFAQPAKPYSDIIDYLSQLAINDRIMPQDCETRTFLHDLPVVKEFNINQIIHCLKQRKAVIIHNSGIITTGTVSPEQAFVIFSSVCFATYVKFFSDYLTLVRHNKIDSLAQSVFEHAVEYFDPAPLNPPSLMTGPFEHEHDIYQALDQAGKYTVQYKLVDSYFGNISYTHNQKIYISQTCSSLDELSGYIDPCPLDGSSCASITASSEYSAHKQIVMQSDIRAILHGHPKFSVIMSMDCELEDCPDRQLCHIRCKKNRSIQHIPIVPGEVGTGPYGLCHTLPKAIRNKPGVIVYGHGVFTVHQIDFNDAFKTMMNIEYQCREMYLQKVYSF